MLASKVQSNPEIAPFQESLVILSPFVFRRLMPLAVYLAHLQTVNRYGTESQSFTPN